MKNLFIEQDRSAILQRLSQITPAAQRKWGTMNPHQMIVHLSDPFKVALEERMVPLRPGALGKFPFNTMVSQWAPWPKGAPTAPEFIQGQKGSALAEFEQDKQGLLSLIDRFSQRDQDPRFPLHPVFGNLTNRQWARVMWRHVDHHLRQFGC